MLLHEMEQIEITHLVAHRLIELAVEGTVHDLEIFHGRVMIGCIAPLSIDIAPLLDYGLVVTICT